MTLQDRADEIVGTMYRSFETETLRDLLNIGTRNAEALPADVDAHVDQAMTAMNEALKREIDRRERSDGE